MPIFRLKYSLTFQVPIEAETEEQARAQFAKEVAWHLTNQCTEEHIAKDAGTW